MGRDRPHLLLFGWYRPGTGFTRVLEALVTALAPHFRITWMGVGYRGPALDRADGVRLEPTDLRGGDMVGAYGARLRWRELQPDLVFALNDLWYLEHYSRELADMLGEVPMVGYLPLDGRLDRPECIGRLDGFRCLLSYTRTAADDLRAALQSLGNTTPVDCLGHGVDLKCFKPELDLDAPDLLRRRMQRAQSFFGLDEPAFVVLNAARPDPRKRIDISLEAFARFARGRSDAVWLCLHQALAHPDHVDPLRARARELGIESRLLWHPREPGPVSDKQLNQLYNACAVGINTAAGEGFGLVSFEHAATGVPQILPDQAALCELWGDAALRIRARPVHTPHSPLQMIETSPIDAAEALARLYDDSAHYLHMARAARTRAMESDLRWSRIGERLRLLLEGFLVCRH